MLVYYCQNLTFDFFHDSEEAKISEDNTKGEAEEQKSQLISTLALPAKEDQAEQKASPRVVRRGGIDTDALASVMAAAATTARNMDPDSDSDISLSSSDDG